jgi:hypothetical protein
MKKQTTLLFLFLFFLLTSLNTNPCYACTIFTATDEETTWFAGNEDQRPNNAYYITDTSGTFGVAYIATPWQQWPLVMQTGINEAGLSFDANWIPTEQLASHPDRLDPGEWPVTHMMKNAVDVEQVIEMIQTYDWGTSMAYQVHFADASGDAAVMHPGPDGELIVTRVTGSFLVSTNFNLKRLQTGDYSCNRYETATSMLSNFEEFSLNKIVSVLDATHQEGEISTIYSTIFDLSNRKIWLFIDSDFENPVEFDLINELEKGDQQISIEELVSNSQNEDTGSFYLTWGSYFVIIALLVILTMTIIRTPN